VAWTPQADGLWIGATSTSGVPTIARWGRSGRTPIVSLTLPSAVSSIAVSTDGRVVVGLQSGLLAMLEHVGDAIVERARIVHEQPVGTVEWFPNGRQVLVRTAPEPFLPSDPVRGGVYLWELGTSTFRRIGAAQLRSARLAPDGERIVGGGETSVSILSLATGADERHMRGSAQPIVSARFLPDGTGLAFGLWDGSVRVWPATGSPRLLRSPAPGMLGSRPRGITGTFVSPADVVVTDQEGLFQIWSRSGAFEPRRIGGTWMAQVTSWSRNGRRAVVSFGYRRSPNRHEIWDLAEGKMLCAVPGHVSGTVVLHPDGEEFIELHPQGIAPGFDQRRLSRTLPDGGYVTEEYLALRRSVHTCEETGVFQAMSVGFSSGGGFSGEGAVLYELGWSEVAFWDARKGYVPIRRVFHQGVQSAAVSPDGRLAATVSGDGRVMLWPLAGSRPLATIDTHAVSTHTIDFSPDGRLLLTAASSGVVKIISVATRRELATLVSLADGSWTVTDAEGHYDASDPNRTEGLHWIIGDDVIGIDQLPAGRFYVPNLLSSLLSDAPVSSLSRQLSQLDPAPDVLVEPLGPGERLLRVRLTNRGGGLGPVRVWVNKREVTGAHRPAAADAATAVVTIDLSSAVFRPEGNDDIQVVALSATDLVAAPARGVRTPVGSLPTKPPDTRLYGLFVGTSAFRNSTLDLQFAAKDAVDMAAAMRLGAERFLTRDRVFLTVLHSGGGRNQQPTKKNILDAFARIAREARPDDTVVAYFAGHGVAHGQDQYFYLTSDANSLELTDARSRDENTISGAELQRWLQVDVKALKQVVVLDTCAAGAATASLASLSVKRNLSPDQLRALAFLQKATGSFVLMGSAADRVSYEANEFGQGLLTYALLTGLSGGPALRNGSDVWVGSWLGHAETAVPDLAVGIGGIQVPHFIRPAGHDFPLMTMTDADRRSIPLAVPRPRVVQPVVIGPRLVDIPALVTALRAELRRASQPLTRGSTGPSGIVYVDYPAADLPRSIAPRIQCTSPTGGECTIVLLREGPSVWESPPITLPGDIAAAAATLAAEIVRASIALGNNKSPGAPSMALPAGVQR
jgi:WD40 repeat protein